MEKLLEILKNELFITWDDEETNKRLTRIISNAIPTMNTKLGAEVEYSEEGMEQNLFINYCVYVYNGKTNDFDDNYCAELMQVRHLYEVQDFED